MEEINQRQKTCSGYMVVHLVDTLYYMVVHLVDTLYYKP